MPEFNPSPNDELTINGETYKVMPHPAVPVFAFGQEGRKAFVFQVAHTQFPEKKFALKKFKLAFRVPELVGVNDSLAQYSAWEGMEVCNRQCFQHGKHDDVLAQYPDLEYAVLMPWITGTTWYDIVIGETPLTLNDSLMFATAVARVLASIEEAGLAHCDIAAANVIVNPTTGRAHLIDVEDLYAPGFEPPAALPAGTDGYAHVTSSNGQWEATADRFAGAVMMAEMVAWHDPKIREMSDEEHYFPQAKLQEDSRHFDLMLEVLEQIDIRLRDLFEQVWFSQTLDKCPLLKEWYDVLQEAHHTSQVSKFVTNWEPILLGGAKPATPEETKPDDNANNGITISAPGGIQTPPPLSASAVPTVSTSGSNSNGHKTSSTAAPTPPKVPSSSPQSPASPPPPTSPSSAGPIKEWRSLGPISSSETASNQFEMRPISAPEGKSEPDDEQDDYDNLYEDKAFLDWVAEEVDAPATLEGDDSALLRPLLQLSHIDDKNRPTLVWTESPLAQNYLLQEDSNADFSQAKTFKIGESNTRWSPRRRRSGRKYYRVRAETHDSAGPWSEPLSLNFGDT